MNGNHSHLIGRDILASQEQQGWGAKVIDRLAADLQRAATKFLTLTILQETEIQVPPLPLQRRIVSILAAYDDRPPRSSHQSPTIKNNARRNANESHRTTRRQPICYLLIHSSNPLLPPPYGKPPRRFLQIESEVIIIKFKQ